MGQKVTFRFDTLGGEEFIGRVSAISPVGQVVNGYAQMETELLLENPDPRIYPGYSFSASITVSGSRENLTIPREYTRWKDDKIFVSLCNEFGVVMEEKEIKVASLGKEKVLVKEGLNPGQWICLPPPLQAEGNMEMFF